MNSEIILTLSYAIQRVRESKSTIFRNRKYVHQSEAGRGLPFLPTKRKCRTNMKKEGGQAVGNRFVVVLVLLRDARDDSLPQELHEQRTLSPSKQPLNQCSMLDSRVNSRLRRTSATPRWTYGFLNKHFLKKVA